MIGLDQNIGYFSSFLSFLDRNDAVAADGSKVFDSEQKRIVRNKNFTVVYVTNGIFLNRERVGI